MKRVIRKTVLNFEVLIHPENGKFWVECSSLRGCYSQGVRLKKHLINMEEAIGLHLEVLEE